MPPSLELSAGGFTVKGLLKSQTVPWASIVACTATRSPMEVIYRDPTAKDGFGKVEVPFSKALEILRNPLFPRLALSVRGAKKVGLSPGEAESFGPPRETKWIGGGPDEKVALRLLAQFPLDDAFVFGDKVGVWPGGVAFDLTEEEGRTLPWDLLKPWTKPAVEGCFLFGWPPGDAGPFEQFLVTEPQGRFVLEYHSGRVWDLNPEVRRSLGMS